MFDEKKLDNLTSEEEMLEKEGCNCGEDCDCDDENCTCDDEGCSCHHDHDHNHDEDGEEIEVQTVFIENEDGTTEELLVIEEFEYDGNTYILVQNEDETVTPLKSVGEEGELEFLSDEEFEEVSKAFNEAIELEDEKFEDAYRIEDDEDDEEEEEEN